MRFQKFPALPNENLPQTKDHWFSYGDCCLAVSETVPAQEPESHHPKHANHVLLFLHGRFGQGEIWRPLVKSLARHFRCLQVDLPGFGRSFCVRDRGFSLLEQSHIIKAILQRFVAAGSKAVLIGHDIGGALAQLCAIHEPQTIAGLVLINSAALTQEAHDFKTGYLCLHVRKKLKKIIRSVSSRLNIEHRSLLMDSWENRSRRASLAHAFRTWQYTWPGPFERQTWKEQIQLLPHPVLLLWGRKDPFNPPSHAEELMRYFPEAYLFENEECGHWPCLEDTDWVDDKMREFLFRISAEISPAHRAICGRR